MKHYSGKSAWTILHQELDRYLMPYNTVGTQTVLVFTSNELAQKFIDDKGLTADHITREFSQEEFRAFLEESGTFGATQVMIDPDATEETSKLLPILTLIMELE